MNYLDTNKSIMISSPAGSGKTEKLARRYIALLKAGVDIERILAITFTDKAAAEMKQRILRILKEEDKKLFDVLLEKMPLMRVSTIHSFCGTLLRRFSFEAGVDPNYKVEDAIDSQMVREEIFYDVLMNAGAGGQGHDLFLETIGEKGFRGLASLKDTIGYLFRKSPFSLKAGVFRYAPAVNDSINEELKSWQGAREAIEGYEELFDNLSRLSSIENLFLTGNKEPRKRPPTGLKGIADYHDWAQKMRLFWKDRKLAEFAERTNRILEIYRKCVTSYVEKKKARGRLDFSDLEYLTYRMLTENPEWANILYAFDEKTDHVLVDEFQDTNNFQWEIINKLTEEWRSGIGAKREEGIQPTIFFVGDEKQSIYFFRGANVEIFHLAKDRMRTWLGDEFSYEEAKDNFRSKPAIVEFANHIFSRIMQADEHSPSWRTRYGSFNAAREGLSDAGKVELVLLDREEETSMDEKRQKEAEALSRMVLGHAGNYRITDRSTRQQRPCGFADMAVLLRKRTHLQKYEKAFRQYGIPFVAVKGIGFYQEPEIAMLRSLIFFLSNPKDDYSLYVLLKSPLFNIDEDHILKLTDIEGDCLFEKMGNNPPLIPPLAFTLLQSWLTQSAYMTVAELIEHALVTTKAWRYFHEAQRRANIKKLIRIVEDLESNGRSLIRIRDFFERTLGESDEPKANVNTENMNAVKIMTIHAAKGLEFPLVFVPGLDEKLSAKHGEDLLFEKDGTFTFKSFSESSLKRDDEDFMIQAAKEEEEQKRLFYVAVTRAEEALFLIGSWDTGREGFLGLLKQGLGIEKDGKTFSVEAGLDGFSLLTDKDVKLLYEHAPGKPSEKKERYPIEVVPFSIERHMPWKSVTETVGIRRAHGKDWVMLGDVIHRILEGVSKGLIPEDNVRRHSERLLISKGIIKEQLQEKTAVIEKDIEVLKEKGVWRDIILPKENSFTELPFILETGDAVYTGRIDRLIKENNRYNIYDYKTFPVKEKEVGYLLKEYSFQLNMYKRAVRELFNTNDVKSFIIFTHTGEIHEV